MLRMARKNIFGVRKKEIFGYHHTIPYTDSRRMWQRLFGGLMSYKGVTIRKHLLNPFFMPIFFREEWTMMIMIFASFLTIENPFFIFLYLFAVILRNKKYIYKGKYIILYVMQRIIQDIFVFLGIFLFYPKKMSYKVFEIM